MAEKQITSAESHDTVPNDSELLELANRRTEVIKDDLERAERAHADRRHTHEADALARAKEVAAHETRHTDQHLPSPAERRRGAIPKKQLANAYDIQMKHARERMTPVGRAFSKVIHIKAIESASDTLGSTIARPNALLCGSIAAFLAVTVLYFLAKYYGFQLSGYETIVAFITGWLLGILYDYFSVLFRRRDN